MVIQTGFFAYTKGAEFSSCRRWRYTLWRIWDTSRPYCAFIGAWRATDPADMKASEEPIGAENDAAILKTAKDAGLVICAWGNHGAYRDRSKHVRKILHDAGITAHCLTTNGSGEPGHPLYLRADSKPIPLNL